MPSPRAINVLPALLVRALVALPPMLLATALGAGHAEHTSLWDLTLQATLLLFMAALLVNVIASVVAILREPQRDEASDDPSPRRATGPEHRATGATDAGKIGKA